MTWELKSLKYLAGKYIFIIFTSEDCGEPERNVVHEDYILLGTVAAAAVTS